MSPALNAADVILARYHQIIENPDAFRVSIHTPLPVSIWVNPLKSSATRLVAHLREMGIPLAPVGWLADAFRADVWPSPGLTVAFTAGWYCVQEEIAMVAVPALNPQPGDRILDLCAAPGGKTAQIALRVQPMGQVIANERQAGRLPSLSTQIARLGLTNVITTQGDGREPLFPAHCFDRVLVDAPCSGEGTLRRRQHLRPWNSTYGLRIAAVQKKLLSRALDWVKPGGTVVYSTCTFAPEENEAVVDAVMGDRAYVEHFDMAGLKGQPGLTQWQEQTYRQDLALARRYYPHLNNTGGFFVARLKRTAANLMVAEPPSLPPLAPVPGGQRGGLMALAQRFALHVDLLKNYQCWSTGKKRCWLTDSHCVPRPGPAPQTLGIPLASATNLGLKPSTAFLQCFAAGIQANRVDLPDTGSVLTFLQGQSQPLSTQASPGYVHVQFKDFALGCGRYYQGRLQSQLPKTLRWPAAAVIPAKI